MIERMRNEYLKFIGRLTSINNDYLLDILFSNEKLTSV